MNSFTAYFSKEILEAKRQHKYIIIAVAILFFAILDPMLLKLLPKLLANEVPQELINTMKITKESAVVNYFKDLFQIGSMILVFVISSSLCDEINSKKLIIPLSKGADTSSIVLAKFVHFVLAIIFALFIGFMVNYYYVNILFNEGSVELKAMFSGVVYFSLYYCFIIAQTLCFSALFSKGFTAGILSLTITFIMAALNGIKNLGKYIPYGLVTEANALKPLRFHGSMATTIIYTTLLLIITIKIFDIKKGKIS